MMAGVPVVERKPQFEKHVLEVITNNTMQSSVLLNIFQVNLTIISCIINYLKIVLTLVYFLKLINQKYAR